MKELIQELVGACIDKGVRFEYNPDYETMVVDSWCDVFFNGDVNGKRAQQRLKTAIEKVKAL